MLHYSVHPTTSTTILINLMKYARLNPLNRQERDWICAEVSFPASVEDMAVVGTDPTPLLCQASNHISEWLMSSCIRKLCHKQYSKSFRPHRSPLSYSAAALHVMWRGVHAVCLLIQLCSDRFSHYYNLQICVIIQIIMNICWVMCSHNITCVLSMYNCCRLLPWAHSFSLTPTVPQLGLQASTRVLLCREDEPNLQLYRI